MFKANHTQTTNAWVSMETLNFCIIRMVKVAKMEGKDSLWKNLKFI